MMKKTAAAASPEAYVGALRGWRREVVDSLRSTVIATRGLEEVIKWRNLVYLSKGPVCMIRAEKARVLFGFWRGQRLRALEPRLKPGGRYEMATLELRQASDLPAMTVLRKLVRAAVALNQSLGDPSAVAK